MCSVQCNPLLSLSLLLGSVTTRRKLTLPLAAFPAVSPPAPRYYCCPHTLCGDQETSHSLPRLAAVPVTPVMKRYMPRNALHTQHHGGLIVTAVATDKQSIHAPKYGHFTSSFRAGDADPWRVNLFSSGQDKYEPAAGMSGQHSCDQ